MRIWDLTPAGPADGSFLAGDTDVLNMEVTERFVVPSLVSRGAIAYDRAAGQVWMEHPFVVEVPTYPVVAARSDLVAGIREDGTSVVTDLELNDAILWQLPRCSAPVAISPDGQVVALDWYEGSPCSQNEGFSGLYTPAPRDKMLDFGTLHSQFAAITDRETFDGQRYAAVVLVDGSESRVEIWDVDRATLVGTLTEDMASDLYFLLVTFSPDGRYLAIGTNGGRVLAADVSSLAAGSSVEDAVIFNKEVHTSNAPIAHITPDGVIATAGFDGFYRFWDLSTGELRLELEVRNLRGHATHAFSPDYAYYFYEDGDSVIRRMPTDVEEMVREAVGSVTRDLTDDECWRYLHLDHCED